MPGNFRVPVGVLNLRQHGHPHRGRSARIGEAGTIAPEGHILAGHGAAGLGLRTVRSFRFGDRQVRIRRNNRPPVPQLGRFPSFLGEGVLMALFAVAGRLVFQLRLTTARRNEDPMILLDLGRDQ